MGRDRRRYNSQGRLRRSRPGGNHDLPDGRRRGSLGQRTAGQRVARQGAANARSRPRRRPLRAVGERARHGPPPGRRPGSRPGGGREGSHRPGGHGPAGSRRRRVAPDAQGRSHAPRRRAVLPGQHAGPRRQCLALLEQPGVGPPGRDGRMGVRPARPAVPPFAPRLHPGHAQPGDGRPRGRTRRPRRPDGTANPDRRRRRAGQLRHGPVRTVPRPDGHRDGSAGDDRDRPRTSREAWHVGPRPHGRRMPSCCRASCTGRPAPPR